MKKNIQTLSIVGFAILIGVIYYFYKELGKSWNEIQNLPYNCLAMWDKKFEVIKNSERSYEIRFPLKNNCDDEFTIGTIDIKAFENQYEVESFTVSFLETFTPNETKYLNRSIFIDEKYKNSKFKLNIDEIILRDFYLDGKLINILGRSFGGPKPYNPASSSSSNQLSSSSNNTFRHLENCADSMWLAKEKERKGSLSSSHYSLINNRELTGKIDDNFLYEGYGDLYKICLNEEEKDPSGFRKKYSK